ncbi:DNA topoisomerase IV subunit A [Candidatus Nanohalococcus occultus]|uniref:Type 2 DNA topoisomerase 6 subunit A n=1 Tax=Candidatus Nanohalococcus occultus TaxID=2978047 RepID=A0ABY8CFK0_9ARCH|nr:DNA topoisomerase VI, subunit A [Candidatus Nanohaloarchaeota archaeon SVXNc]
MPKKDLANDETTIEKLTHLGRKLKNQLYDADSENLTIETKVRSKSNVEYDEEDGRLELGDSFSQRKFLNISHARKFMQTTLVASKAKELVENGRTASIREVYYQLKHTVPGLDENTFEDQDESNNVVVDIETATGAIREDLHLFAEPKGRLFGPIKINDSGDTIDGMSMGSAGMAIPSIVDHLEFEENNADFILVVETSAMVNRLVEEDFHEEQNAIIIGTGGQPARGARRLINMMHNELDLPVYVFTDGDPWGYYIYSVLKSGSMSLAFQSDRLATPDAKLIGMTMEDIETYDLHHVTEDLKGKPKGSGGPTKDFKRIHDVMDYEWMKNDDWQNQLQKMLDMGVRVEQQALAAQSLEFVANEYLPNKIENEEFLD